MERKKKLKRLKSPNDIYTKSREILPFQGEWAKHIGMPEIRGSWFVFGHSGNGKTSYLTQMAAMLTKFGRVWYLGAEEGDSESFKQAMRRAGLRENFNLCEDEFDDLLLRLEGRNTPDYLFFDSVQAVGMSKDMYQALLDICDKKNCQLILISHAEGKKPEGRPAKFMHYMSFVKIWVEGFKAFPLSRYGGTEPFVIFPERAAEYWGDVA
ncbi:hypothetical protein Q4603_05845 [Zobellia galactanivorans]|uniref:hypothetical protein n=1 Tax=Zobellia galactanivorans (strain DSM 12802 / CCUG 47099 / CIP 106680 / NCIMB 13871 / Dsij) TaxID=63186 RepID=UPI0026E4662A|nr:hypothetical protein [Zobellia galactanivorans]MDO6808118.1 hypothetical protein [Zobellia galactanivorans]